MANGEIARIANEISAATNFESWEICYSCVAPSYRGSGLARRLLEELEALIKPKGAKRLLTSYVAEKTGDFWPRLGFEVLPTSGGKLLKGFQTDPEKEGLRADVHLKLGERRLC